LQKRGERSDSIPKYFGKNPKYKKSLGIYTTTLTTRDHLLTVDETREMWKVASLEEKVMIKTWLLGLRIGDACKLEWQQFNLKPTEEPQEVLISTHKEGITAHVFVDSEFQESVSQWARAGCLSLVGENLAPAFSKCKVRRNVRGIKSESFDCLLHDPSIKPVRSERIQWLVIKVPRIIDWMH